MLKNGLFYPKINYSSPNLGKFWIIFPHTPPPATEFLLFILACNPLLGFARYSLDYSLTNSWFCFIRNLTCQYALPDPIDLLENPPSKIYFKRLTWEKVVEVWHKEPSNSASTKSPLKFLWCIFLPLLKGPHPLWTSFKSSRPATQAACVQAKMLSGQYCTDHLSAKWLGGNGACSLPGCGYPLGDLEHLLSGRYAPLREATIAGV